MLLHVTGKDTEGLGHGSRVGDNTAPEQEASTCEWAWWAHEWEGRVSGWQDGSLPQLCGSALHTKGRALLGSLSGWAWGWAGKGSLKVH